MITCVAVHKFEELNGFCEFFSMAIGEMCSFGAHKGHNYRSLEEVRVEKTHRLSVVSTRES